MHQVHVRDARFGAVAWLGALMMLCVAVDMTLGLGAAGWTLGALTGVGLAITLARQGNGGLGPADQITATRAVLAGGVAALVADGFFGADHVTALVAMAALALGMDLVDGYVARRTGTESAFGARFDMEVDAFLILVLSVYVAMWLGPWVLLIGAMRYVFVAAARALPWLNGALPPSMARKTVAALQGIVLLVVAAGIVPVVAALVAVLGALALLVWSFGRDIGWLWRVRA